MKKISTIIAVALAAVVIVSCKSTPEATIANLKTSIDGEMNASVKYAIFAAKALEEGHFEIAALFQATSMAEEVHAKNHNVVLVGLGQQEYVPVIAEIAEDSTAKNLEVAMSGETYEYETMYPGFIAVAEKESVLPAIVSFNYANDTEKGHAALYANAIVKFGNPAIIGTVYYVCPTCGNVFDDEPSETCELCQTGSDQFFVSIAQKRVAAEDIAPVSVK